MSGSFPPPPPACGTQDIPPPPRSLEQNYWASSQQVPPPPSDTTRQNLFLNNPSKSLFGGPSIHSLFQPPCINSVPPPPQEMSPLPPPPPGHNFSHKYQHQLPLMHPPAMQAGYIYGRGSPADLPPPPAYPPPPSFPPPPVIPPPPAINKFRNDGSFLQMILSGKKTTQTGGNTGYDVTEGKCSDTPNGDEATKSDTPVEPSSVTPDSLEKQSTDTAYEAGSEPQISTKTYKQDIDATIDINGQACGGFPKTTSDSVSICDGQVTESDSTDVSGVTEENRTYSSQGVDINYSKRKGWKEWTKSIETISESSKETEEYENTRTLYHECATRNTTKRNLPESSLANSKNSAKKKDKKPKKSDTLKDDSEDEETKKRKAEFLETMMKMEESGLCTEKGIGAGMVK